MSNKFRRGLVNHNAPGPQVVEPTPQIVGRQFNSRVGRQPEMPEEQPIILDRHGSNVNAPRRGIVNAQGQSYKGLQQASIDARRAQQEVEDGRTEICNRCGKERGVSAMVTLVQGHHEHGSEGCKVRICKACKAQAYRNPQQGTTENWNPQRQAVRFSDDGRPYDGSRVGLGTLVNGDTYHQGNLTDATEAPSRPHFQSSAARVGKLRG